MPTSTRPSSRTRVCTALCLAILAGTMARTGVAVAEPVFEHAGTYSVGEQPAVIRVGDFNKDGRHDLSVVSRKDGSATILLAVDPSKR